MRRDEPELSGTLTPTSRAWLRHHTREARTPISAEEESAKVLATIEARG